MTKVLIGLPPNLVFVCFFCFSLDRNRLGWGPVGPRLEPPSLRAAREGQRGLRCPAEACAARPFRFCLQRRAMLLKPVCARKAFLWGSAKDLCSGTRALLGECFLWSSPTRLGRALTMYVFYPSTLGPCGSHRAPVATPGPLPRSSLPSLFSVGERLPEPLVLSQPRASAPWEGASGLQTQCGCLEALPITHHFFMLLLSQTPFLSQFL